MSKSKSPMNFETAISRLSQIVEQMEKGELSLEDSLKYFREGIELTKTCQQALRQAEQEVMVLEKEIQNLTVEPSAIGVKQFHEDDNDE